VVICPGCGTNLADGTLVCPVCQTEMGQQAGAYPEGEGPLELDASVPGSTIPPERGGPLPDDWTVEDLTHGIGVDTSIPGQDIPPERGGGLDWSQPPSDEPPPGLTDTKELDFGRAELPGRDDGLSLDAPRGTVSRSRRYGSIAAVILALILIIGGAAGLYYLGDKDDDGNGEPNGHENGNGPPPTGVAFQVDEGATAGSYEYEPNPSYHLTVVVKNAGDKAGDLADHEVYVTVFVGTQKRGEATETLSGTLAAGATRSVDVLVDPLPMDPGDEYTVSVMLRKGAQHLQVDLYSYKETV
jgi:hypothetical protein